MTSKQRTTRLKNLPPQSRTKTKTKPAVAKTVLLQVTLLRQPRKHNPSGVVKRALAAIACASAA